MLGGGGLVDGGDSVCGDWDGVSTGYGFQRSYANLTVSPSFRELDSKALFKGSPTRIIFSLIHY